MALSAGTAGEQDDQQLACWVTDGSLGTCRTHSCLQSCLQMLLCLFNLPCAKQAHLGGMKNHLPVSFSECNGLHRSSSLQLLSPGHVILSLFTSSFACRAC